MVPIQKAELHVPAINLQLNKYLKQYDIPTISSTKQSLLVSSFLLFTPQNPAINWVQNSKLLVPIYWNHIMFAHDLCQSQIEYVRNAIDLNRKDRAKRYHKSSIFNRQYSIPACSGWVFPNPKEVKICCISWVIIW